MMDEAEIYRLVDRIVARMRPDRVILFGSYAKGKATHKSDLDLLVVKDTVLPMERRVDDVRPILSGMLTSVDVHVYTPEEVDEYGREPLSFIASVLASGRTLYPS